MGKVLTLLKPNQCPQHLAMFPIRDRQSIHNRAYGFYCQTKDLFFGCPVYRHATEELYMFYIFNKGWVVNKEVDQNYNDAFIKAQCRRMKPFKPNSPKLKWMRKNGVMAAVEEVEYYYPKYAEKNSCIHHRIRRRPSSGEMPSPSWDDQGIPRNCTYPRKLKVEQYAKSLPGKVGKLIGVYEIMENRLLYGMPVWKHQNGLAYLFYCKFYDKNDWRISQTLPKENERAPARIRADQIFPNCPLDPELFWEAVDEQDHWYREHRSVNIVWHVDEPHLEPVCANVFTKLGLSYEDSHGWLAKIPDRAVQDGLTILHSITKYLKRENIRVRSSYGNIKKRAMGFPSEIQLHLRDSFVPPIARSLLGTYAKTSISLYDIPVYQLQKGNGWLYYCRKYTNHDWRVGPSLPSEGARAPARIRSYTRDPCSPLEPGLFWEAVNLSNSWNTRSEAVFTSSFQEPNKEVFCNAVLSSLGLPRNACEGWLADYTNVHMVDAITLAQIFSRRFRFPTEEKLTPRETVKVCFWFPTSK